MYLSSSLYSVFYSLASIKEPTKTTFEKFNSSVSISMSYFFILLFIFCTIINVYYNVTVLWLL